MNSDNVDKSGTMHAMFIPWNNILRQIWQQRGRDLAALVLASLLAACGKTEAPVTAPARLPLVEGQAFPAVSFKTLSGASVSLQSLRGKMLILNVWATWCQPCRREMPSLQRLSQALDPQRFAVLGMSTDGDELLATEFLNSNHITFDNYLDRNGRLSQQMGLEAYPETFLIAQDGTLVKRILGQQDWSSPDMMQMLEEKYQLNQRVNSGYKHADK